MTEFEPNHLEFSQQFKRIREKTGLSVEEFAQYLGVHRNIIPALVNGALEAPNQEWFYNQLKLTPGVEEKDIEELLSARGAPKEFVDPLQY